ncbi:hypothetical protein HHI36_003025 [Cryptolaemus montrouzieri]|uniref:Uncharacterized protein n=1 Tax=Cryptolaemus montrouzieri TaxID=559131 RepID=A0ABD2PC84_9CUCU
MLKQNRVSISYGKGAWDGLAESVKRQAYRESLKRDNYKHIINGISLFQWAENSAENVHFGFCSQQEHDPHEQQYRSRYKQSVTIKNTRQYHHYKAVDNTSLECKLPSKDIKVIKNRELKKE